MKVKITKVNEGVLFQVLTAKGAPAQRKSTHADRAALDAAADWYLNEVASAFKASQAGGLWELAGLRTRGGLACSMMLPLEPWGFASGSFEDPKMADTGSSPTPQRARKLLCYQWPLDQKDGGFSREVTIKMEQDGHREYYRVIL